MGDEMMIASFGKKFVALVGGAALAETLAVGPAWGASAVEISESGGYAETVTQRDGPGNTIQFEKVNGPTRVNMKFVRYLTSAWAKASSYTWGTTTTVNSSLSADIGYSAGAASAKLGATSSTSQAWSVSVSIPASASRWSKLRLQSNVDRYSVRSRGVWQGVPGAWRNATLDAPVKGGQFLSVAYQ